MGTYIMQHYPAPLTTSRAGLGGHIISLNNLILFILPSVLPHAAMCKMLMFTPHTIPSLGDLPWDICSPEPRFCQLTEAFN